MLHELTEREAGLLVMLFTHLAGLDLAHVEDLGDSVRITARARTAALVCRGCGVLSSRVHDRYRRRLAGLGSAGGRCRWCWRPAGSAAATRRVRWRRSLSRCRG